MDKILPVIKPEGISTYDVIREYKRKTGFKGKIGHAGTLDPFATGVVLLLLGKETKRFDEIRAWEKVYLAGVRLGATSTTGDPEGEITPVSPKHPTKREIKKAIKMFVGETEQKVPAFSAAKHKGVPLYKLARQGKTVEKSKKVKISKIKFVDYKYPALDIRVTCSGGTYIRQLAQDIGEKLETGAFLQSLEREKIGKFSKKDCCSLNDFSVENSLSF